MTYMMNLKYVIFSFFISLWQRCWKDKDKTWRVSGFVSVKKLSSLWIQKITWNPHLKY